jgi:hypothetical protein
MFCTGIYLLPDILYWNVPTDGVVYTGYFHFLNIFVLECPYGLNIWYWNVPTDGVVYTGYFYFLNIFVLECPYVLNRF